MSREKQSPHVPYAYQLRYSWSAWPSGQERFPPKPNPQSLQGLEKAWEADGLRPLEWIWTPEGIQILFSALPSVNPVFLAQRAKGRLQQLLRKEGTPVNFSRKVSVASVGNPREKTVEKYLQAQLDGGDFADPGYRNALADLAYEASDFSLTEPTPTHSGRYVYALHVVLVTADRWRMPSETAGRVRQSLLNLSEASSWKMGKLAMMPDHLHLALRGDPLQSPQEMAEALREASSAAVGTKGFLMPGAYLGTFGPYGMAGIRAKIKEGNG